MTPPPSLTALANEEGTDKGTVGPAADWPVHNYTDMYDGYLNRLRGEPITLLEIGMGVRGPMWDSGIAQGRNAAGGASIRMWRRYFNRARILGIDVNPAPHLDDERVTTGVADQSDPQQIAAFLDHAGVASLDVVIDDGSHQAAHQQVSFATLFPRLSAGGLYFIEDLLDNGTENGAEDARVLSTRSVFAGLLTAGRFPEPNMLGPTDRLAETIDKVTFHCPVGAARIARPTRRIAGALQLLCGRRVPAATFVPGTEAVCVVQKTA